MEAIKFVASIVGTAVGGTAILGSIVKILHVAQTKAVMTSATSAAAKTMANHS
jgi:hypothetical protein